MSEPPIKKPFYPSGNGHRFSIGNHRSVSLFTGKDGDAYIICVNHEAETKFRLSPEASHALLTLLKMHCDKVEQVRELMMQEIMQCA